MGGARQPGGDPGIIPNFRSVSAIQKLPPETGKEKVQKRRRLESFRTTRRLRSLPDRLGRGQAQDSYPEFRQGARPVMAVFRHTFADQTDEKNLWVQASRSPA